MGNEKAKGGLLERGANFFEKLHYGIGAVALVGAAVLEAPVLAVISVYEFAHGALWNYLKGKVTKNPRSPLVPA